MAQAATAMESVVVAIAVTTTPVLHSMILVKLLATAALTMLSVAPPCAMTMAFVAVKHHFVARPGTYALAAPSVVVDFATRPMARNLDSARSPLAMVQVMHAWLPARFAVVFMIPIPTS
jgi:hypothetical protein